MECLKCYNDMFIDYVVLNVKRDNYNLEFKKIPGYVCSECKETYIEDQQLEKIFDMISELDAKTEQIKNKGFI